jgi:hypothetical protein
LNKINKKRQTLPSRWGAEKTKTKHNTHNITKLMKKTQEKKKHRMLRKIGKKIIDEGGNHMDAALAMQAVANKANQNLSWSDLLEAEHSEIAQEDLDEEWQKEKAAQEALDSDEEEDTPIARAPDKELLEEAADSLACLPFCTEANKVPENPGAGEQQLAEELFLEAYNLYRAAGENEGVMEINFDTATNYMEHAALPSNHLCLLLLPLHT